MGHMRGDCSHTPLILGLLEAVCGQDSGETQGAKGETKEDGGQKRCAGGEEHCPEILAAFHGGHATCMGLQLKAMRRLTLWSGPRFLPTT